MSSLVDDGAVEADDGAGRDARGRVRAIKLAMQTRIGEGTYPPGSRLPSERQLCAEFGTTRVSLKDVLIHLEAEGIVYREERRGWFVSPARFIYDPQARGHFTLSTAEQGRTPTTRVIDRRMVSAPPHVARLLGLADGAALVCIRRIRSIDGRAVLYVEHYYRPEVFPGLFERDLSGSLTELFRDAYDFHYGRMTYRITSTSVSGEAAAALRTADGSPTLLVTRVNYGLADGIRDCDLEYWRHDAVLIEVETRHDAPAR